MDALASFTHLTDNLPLWLSRLETLSARVAEQHAKFSQLTAATETKLARRKTDSTESLRPQNEMLRNEETLAQTNPHIHDTLNAETTALDDITNDVLAVRQARRKRKPTSALSDASGPQKYRTRTMVIVYYDSDIQDAFEFLVRNIAGARNNLRKGRTAATFKARMASLAKGPPLFSAGGERDTEPNVLRPAKKPILKVDNASPAFETIDKYLENAQISCEKSAHQMLRDGNCREELLATKNNIQNSLGLAQKEVEKLQAEEAQEAAEQTQEKDPVSIRVEEKTTSSAVKPVEYTGIGTIEVDDGSDAESIHVDLSAIRRARRV